MQRPKVCTFCGCSASMHSASVSTKLVKLVQMCEEIRSKLPRNRNSFVLVRRGSSSAHKALENLPDSRSALDV